ncbi:MAG TPA: enolase C-terminal domain-like protein [Xanthobacteraceae bacterium]|nr:enolase C-terminal domain-like protein [Xanthobacteraceae bacterium]
MQIPASTPRPALNRPALVIRRVDAIPVALPLRKPVRMATETVTHARNLLVRVEATDGTVGWGEAASAPAMTGDTLGGLTTAVREHLAPALTGADAWMRPALMKRLRTVLHRNAGAHAAVETALIDLAGQASGLPLVDLMGGPLRREVAPMWLIGNATPDEDVAEAKAKAGEGIRFFKLKVGVKPLETEIAVALAVREALGPDVAICADANCGFSYRAARRYLEATREAGLLFLEQPFEDGDLKGLAALARCTAIQIGADEGIHSLRDIEAHAAAGAGGVSLKLIKLGGFAAALTAGALCRHLGLAVNVAAKMAESSLSAAAMVHLACALDNVDWGVSLTHFYLAEDIVRVPLAIEDGLVALPGRPGVGLEIDEAAVARLRVNSLEKW